MEVWQQGAGNLNIKILLLIKANQLSHIKGFSAQLACNAGDPGLISGSGNSPAEGIGYPLQYSGASLVTQLVKNLPAMWQIWV